MFGVTKSCALRWCLVMLVVAAGFGCPATPTAPSVSQFQINGGDATTASRAVTLTSTVSGSPTHYMASESPAFANASWQPYATSVSFELSAGNVVKTVHFRVKNAGGNSADVSDTIMLQETEGTIMLPGDVPLTLVWIPGNTYFMGRYEAEQDSSANESPQHAVSINSFWMAKYEITKRQWQAVMGTTPWSGNDNVLDNLDSPAVFVSWDDAEAFVLALNQTIADGFRLPSEAQWEFAARAGTSTRFYWGDDAGTTVGDDYAWWIYTAWGVDEAYAHVVGQLIPNDLGLYDMSGNVLEWCKDDWHADYTGAPNVEFPWVDAEPSANKVVRGGSWFSSGEECRSAWRGFYDHSVTSQLIGFRIAISN